VPQLEAIECDWEYATSIEKSFMIRNQTSDQISENFHILDSGDHLAGIKINMLTERKFSVEYETQVFPGVFGEKNRSAKGRKVEWRGVKRTM